MKESGTLLKTLPEFESKELFLNVNVPFVCLVEYFVHSVKDFFNSNQGFEKYMFDKLDTYVSLSMKNKFINCTHDPIHRLPHSDLI